MNKGEILKIKETSYEYLGNNKWAEIVDGLKFRVLNDKNDLLNEIVSLKEGNKKQSNNSKNE